ncbi:MAG: hypothetical protein AAB709_01590, partial [Patescibacteria group bacterium]
MAHSSEKPRSRNQDELQLRAVAEFKARQRAKAETEATEAEIIEIHPSGELRAVLADEVQQPVVSNGESVSESASIIPEAVLANTDVEKQDKLTKKEVSQRERSIGKKKQTGGKQDKKEGSEKGGIPVELKEIFGNNVSKGVLDTYIKLKKEDTKKSYLAKLRVEKAEKTREIEAFGSVVSGTIDRLKDVDTSGMRTEYSNAKPLGWMQKDMNALKGDTEFAVDAAAVTPDADFIVPRPYIGGTPFDSESSEIREKIPAAEPVSEIPPTAQALEGLEQEAVDRNIAATHPSISNAHENE